MRRAARAIARIARTFPDIYILVPAHLNPVVRENLMPPLAKLHNVVVTEPLAYGDFVRAMNNSLLLLTDSGGVQEEAPSLGKPVLVMRETSERPEAIEAGTARLVGTDEARIFHEVSLLVSDPGRRDAMARRTNPYGDGRAASRAIQAMEHFFGLSVRPADFEPGHVMPQPAVA